MLSAMHGTLSFAQYTKTLYSDFFCTHMQYFAEKGETACSYQMSDLKWIFPYIIRIHILHTVLCTFTKVLTQKICPTRVSLVGDQRQEFLQLVIISFILMKLVCDSVVILQGAIGCSSLLRVKSLSQKIKNQVRH